MRKLNDQNAGESPRRSLRIPDANWAAYDQAAKAQGLKLSEWIRRVLDRAAKRKPRTGGAQSQS